MFNQASQGFPRSQVLETVLWRDQGGSLPGTMLCWCCQGSWGRPAREETAWRYQVCSVWLCRESWEQQEGLTGRPVLGSLFTEPLPCSRHVTYVVLRHPPRHHQPF